MAGKIKQAVTTSSVFAKVCHLENWLILVKYNKHLQTENMLNRTEFTS